MPEYYSLIAHSIAALAASWCLRHNFRFATVGFGLLLADGITGVLVECLDETSSLGDVHQFVGKCNDSLSLALFATEACLFDGIQYNFAVLNLVVPICDFLATYAFDSSVDDHLVRLSGLASLLSIAYTSFDKQQVFGYALTASEASVLPGIGSDNLIEDDPTRILISALSAMFCIHFLLDKQSVDV